MRIGIPREVKTGEARVGATPAGVAALTARGHEVLVERGAGDRVGFDDGAYQRAGATVVRGPGEAFACAIVVKVKELQPQEYPLLGRGVVVLAFHQLARDPTLLHAVLSRGATCLAYEGVSGPGGVRPLLAPMSRIAGTLSAQIAAWALQRRDGPLTGSGVLLWSLEGIPPARVVVIGPGVAGRAATLAFLRVGCAVTVLARRPPSASTADVAVTGPDGSAARALVATPEHVAAACSEADVVVGAVSVPGRLSPKLVTRETLRAMRPGSVLVDIGIDMGGIAVTSRQTTLSNPLFVDEGVLHYGVPNIPALTPRSATEALTAATAPVVQLLADRGLDGAIAADPGLRDGLLVRDGTIVHPGLAADAGAPRSGA